MRWNYTKVDITQFARAISRTCRVPVEGSRTTHGLPGGASTMYNIAARVTRSSRLPHAIAVIRFTTVWNTATCYMRLNSVQYTSLCTLYGIVERLPGLDGVVSRKLVRTPSGRRTSRGRASRAYPRYVPRAESNTSPRALRYSRVCSNTLLDFKLLAWRAGYAFLLAFSQADSQSSLRNRKLKIYTRDITFQFS